MKGVKEIKLYLGSGQELSASLAKDILPASEVPRDALLHVILELHKELTTLKANRPINAQPERAGETTTAAEASTPSNAARVTTPLNATTPPFQPAAQNGAAAENPEGTRQRLCKSMWGRVECPGTGCTGLHLRWCSKPTCAIDQEQSKSCNLWHGHMRALRHHERARKKKEAEQRKSEEEQRDFKAWQKERDQGNGKRGVRGPPNAKRPNPQPHDQKQGPRVRGEQRVQRRPPRPATRSLGDFFPPLPTRTQRAPTYVPAPMPAKSAWEKPLHTNMATRPEARQQLQDILHNLGMILQSGVF